MHDISSFSLSGLETNLGWTLVQRRAPPIGDPNPDYILSTDDFPQLVPTTPNNIPTSPVFPLLPTLNIPAGKTFHVEAQIPPSSGPSHRTGLAQILIPRIRDCVQRVNDDDFMDENGNGGPVATGFLASSPSTPAPMPIHPVDSPSTLFSSTALEKRVEGLELSVRQLQATTSLQLDSSTATAQATSSAALARPSPGNTHSLDRETPSTPRVVTTLCDSQELELQAARTKLLLQGSSLDTLQASLPQVQSSLPEELALELCAELPPLSHALIIG
ncbi:unnamed protein product [Gadus morhua 'NCC']